MEQQGSLFEHVTRHVGIAVVREESVEDGWDVARCFAENGMRTIEVTMTSPEAFSLISRLADRYSDNGVVIAAGTVRSTNEAAVARRAGARIIVSPHTDARVIEYANEHDLLCVAGAATPTEVIRAWELGANVIKIYPARLLGGPTYIRTISQPIRGIPMLAGGPVDLEEIDEYLDAGAIAVNLGASLAVPRLVAEKRWEEIEKRVALALGLLTRSPREVAETAVVE